MKNIKGVKITALIFLGWTIAILLLFMIGETSASMIMIAPILLSGLLLLSVAWMEKKIG
jgi:hypothetical protein